MGSKMDKIICLYEDEKTVNLNPLVYLRPVFELKTGILSIRKKYQNMHPELKYIFKVRKELDELYSEKNPNYYVNSLPDTEEPILFINARMIPDKQIFNYLLEIKEPTVFKNTEGETAAFIVRNTKDLNDNLMQKDFPDIKELSIEKEETIDAMLFSYPWELININGQEIIKDFELLTEEEPENIQGKVYEGVHLLNQENIFIAPSASVKPGVVLDAESGPIYIDDNAVIMPNATIEGPAYIGRESIIKIGAKIYENTSIGEVCKVGGEVEESIIHSFANKQHEGFLGHSYLCPWVNLGADTNNSDLKNNYSSVTAIINDNPVDTGLTFVGLIMGDHSKTGINTMLNTGTVAGVGCNIFGSDFPPKYIPSFSWGGHNSLTTYKFDKFIEVAKKVMARRNRNLSDIEIELLQTVFEKTKPERLKRDMQE